MKNKIISVLLIAASVTIRIVSGYAGIEGILAIVISVMYAGVLLCADRFPAPYNRISGCGIGALICQTLASLLLCYQGAAMGIAGSAALEMILMFIVFGWSVRSGEPVQQRVRAPRNNGPVPHRLAAIAEQIREAAPEELKGEIDSVVQELKNASGVRSRAVAKIDARLALQVNILMNTDAASVPHICAQIRELLRQRQEILNDE